MGFLDIRIEKTERAIKQAFMELRAEKPLEKIRVKELCDRACINKSTFYAHYQDIYALANAMEDEMVEAVVASLPNLTARDVSERTEWLAREMFHAFAKHQREINTLFADSRQGLCHDTRLYLFSDNHDVERLPNKLRNREHIRHIAILVYTLWGIPSIYYGSEFGIEGKKEWGSDWPLRPCLELEDYKDALTTNPVTSVYAALGKLKAEEPALTWGEFKELHLTTQCYAYARVLDGEALVAVLNNGDSPAQLEFQLPVEANAAEDLLADTVGAQPVMTSFDWGRMKVQLPSNYATILRLKK